MPALVILQARMASTRLAGKMLLPLGGWPLVEWPIRRLESVAPVVLATSINPADDPLAGHVDVPVVLGSEEDVLGRFVAVAEGWPEADILIRATGDNPLVLPELAEGAIETLTREGADYCSIEGSALGTTVEILTREALLRIDRLATDPAEREHCTLGILRRPEQFRIARFVAPESYRASNLRLTIDTQADFDFVAFVIQSIALPPASITWSQVQRAAAQLTPRESSEEQRWLSEVQRLKEHAWQP